MLKGSDFSRGVELGAVNLRSETKVLPRYGNKGQLQVFPALGTHWVFGPWDFGVIGY